jgi:hypothetical protein
MNAKFFSYAVSTLRWVMFAANFIVYPVCVAFLFAGGWFVGIMWWCAYDWLKDFDEDCRKAVGRGQKPTDTFFKHTNSNPRGGMWHQESTVDLGYPPYRDSDRGFTQPRYGNFTLQDKAEMAAAALERRS